MSFSMLDLARGALGATLKDAGDRARLELIKLVLGVVAVALLVSAGLVALAQEVGYPLAATAFAGIFGLAALVVHLVGRQRAARKTRQRIQAQNRMQADIALAKSAARAARPFWPLAAFVAAFALARRW